MRISSGLAPPPPPPPPLPLVHTKRHVTSGLYPNDRRIQQHEHPPTNDSNNNSSQSNTNNGFTNRGWKRPCMLFIFIFQINFLLLSYKIQGENPMDLDHYHQHLKYVKFPLNLILFQN